MPALACRILEALQGRMKVLEEDFSSITAIAIEIIERLGVCGQGGWYILCLVPYTAHQCRMLVSFT